MLRSTPREQRRAFGTASRGWAAVAIALLLLPSLGASGDPGLVLEVDRRERVLRARDLAYRRAHGPVLRVALGSPAHPTPVGVFPAALVIWNPSFTPGPAARASGARPHPPASDGPLGVAKIPFGDGGTALHGGAHRFAPGQRITWGCVEARNEDLLALLKWLGKRDALAPKRRHRSGEIHQSLRRPVRIVVR